MTEKIRRVAVDGPPDPDQWVCYRVPGQWDSSWSRPTIAGVITWANPDDDEWYPVPAPPTEYMTVDDEGYGDGYPYVPGRPSVDAAGLGGAMSHDPEARQVLEPLGWTEDDDWVEIVLDHLAAAGYTVTRDRYEEAPEDCYTPCCGDAPFGPCDCGDRGWRRHYIKIEGSTDD